MCKAKREAYWSEKDTEQKVETLVAELVYTQRKLAEITSCTSELMKHTHADGQIVRPVKMPGEEQYDFHVRVYERK